MSRYGPMALLLLIMILQACSPGNQSPTAATQAITPSIDAGAPQLTSAGATVAPPATGTPPSSPGSLAVWPLPADLYYLNSQGQVWRQPAGSDEIAAVQISPQDQAVADFAIAPGGEWMLYRSSGNVYVISLADTQGQSIAQNVGAPTSVPRGQTIGWSPDASRIAYSVDGGFQVYVAGGATDLQPLVFAIPIQSGQPVVDLRWSFDSRWLLVWLGGDGSGLMCDTGDLAALQCLPLGRLLGYAWLFDGRLAFAPAEGGLALMAPTSPDTRTLIVDQEQAVSLPIQRPDGSLVFFLHANGISDLGILHSGNIGGLSFQSISTAGLTTSDLQWDAIGERLIRLGSDQSIRLVDPVTGASGELDTSGNPVSFVWGDVTPRGVSGLPMPASLYFLAPEAGITQVWKLAASGEPPATITRASTDVTAFDVSVDGSQVVYTSGGAIFVQTIDTTEVVQIAQLAPDVHIPSGTPAFSPSGRRVAYANNGIWVYDSVSGDALRLVADNPASGPALDEQAAIYERPRWSPDGQWILARVTYFQGYDFALLPSGGPNVRPIPLNQFNSQAEWGENGRVYVYSDGSDFSQPQILSIYPGRVPDLKQLVALPVLDVQARPDGRLAFLRSPSPAAFGPTSVRLFSMAADGTDVRAETGSLVIENPQLSPDAVLVAGLIKVQRGVSPASGVSGFVAGQLVVVNPATLQVFVIEGATGAHDLLWGK